MLFCVLCEKVIGFDGVGGFFFGGIWLIGYRSFVGSGVIGVLYVDVDIVLL